jgi:predicted RNA-binding protein associated with RNAse of E/G family
MRPGDAHTIEVWWDAEWSLLGWYVNLQAPLVVEGDRFDTMDWVLDVVVDPDGTWCWKDEDEFVQAIELGVFDSEAAGAAVRAEGKRVIAERPWPTGWEDWRPPQEWTPLPLPKGWEVV